MKKYCRETKTWIEEEEHVSITKKRKACKGGQEHDWMLCLPSWAHHNNTELGFDVAKKYYEIEDAREDMDIAFDEKLEELGIKGMEFRISKLLGRRRSYICSVCQKRK